MAPRDLDWAAMRFAHLTALSFLVLVTGACTPVQRVRQCQVLLAKVNPALDEVEKLAAPPAGEDPEKLRAISARYAGLDKSLAADPPVDDDLKKAAAELGATFKETATAMRALADALTPPAKSSVVAEERRRLAVLVVRERTAAARLDAVCRSH